MNSYTEQDLVIKYFFFDLNDYQVEEVSEEAHQQILLNPLTPTWRSLLLRSQYVSLVPKEIIRYTFQTVQEIRAQIEKSRYDKIKFST